MNKHYYAVIMAGGVGSRFWPVSTEENPKQFHDMLGIGESLIQNTFSRLRKIIPKENILVATNTRYKELVLRHLPEISEKQLLLEPVMRNTAPCVLYSALKISNLDPKAVVIIAPSDHFIANTEEFVKNIKTAFDACEKEDILMTLGIKPSSPNTGYGYIKYIEGSEKIKKVKDFTEKPDLQTAEQFLLDGSYLWNAGIFVWGVRSILSSFKNNLGEMYRLLAKGEQDWNSDSEDSFIQLNYEKAENISIDYGIMESADNVYVLPVDFGWNDLGTWGSLFDKLTKDDYNNAIVNARSVFIDASNNMVRTQKNKKIIVKGLSDYIIVETDDKIMILPKSDEQEIKQISAEATRYFKND
jgi:mannose-1-phosphate guanylyltransferase